LIAHVAMNNNENNPQQPVIPYGLIQNQMMQHMLSSLQMNQMAGMQWNGPGPPQMQPSLPMFLNSHPAMGGMHQHFFNPMIQQFGQMPMNPHLAMGGMPPEMALMGALMAGQMPPMPQMPGQMLPYSPMQNPFVQYVPVPVFMTLPAGTSMPTPIPIKKEDDNDNDSIIECTPRSVPQPKFSISNILEREVKKEPVDQEDASLPNTSSNNNNLSCTRPVTTSDSPIRPNKFPSPSLPTASMTREDFPNTLASSANRCNDQEGEGNQQIVPSQSLLSKPVTPSITPPSQAGDSCPSHENLQESLVEGDEYLSCDEPLDNRAEEPVIIPTPPSRWERDSTREKSPHDTGSTYTPPRLVIVESDESTFTVTTMDESNEQKMSIDGGKKIKEEITVDEGMSKSETDGGCEREMNSQEMISHTTDVSKPLFYMNPTPEESPRAPSIPKRFPVRRTELIGPIDRREKLREEITSPWRMKKSRMRKGGRDGSEESPDRKKRRVNAYSILADGVPLTVDEERIERYFDDRYGRCRVTRVYAHPSTVRIEFKSKRDRDHAYSHRTVFVSSHKLTIHEDLKKERSESREEAGPSRDCRRHSPIRVDSNEDIEMNENDIQLEKYDMECEKGYPRKENLLTAGPLPRECSLTSVIKYFRRESAAAVFNVPYPTHRPHEYLILRFSNISDAKRTLAQQEHVVDGHLIPVSPPYDVHLQLNGMEGLEKEAMVTIQEECGVLINYPIVHRGSMHRGPVNMFGYVTFGRPQDAQEAIAIGLFNVDGRPFKVANSDRNYSFKPFKELWEVKSKLAEMSKKEHNKKTRKEKRNCIRDNMITDYHIPILTIGPIPDHCMNECDKYLLSKFDVYEIPYEMNDRNFRIVTSDDSDMMVDILSEGYIRMGKKEERVLVSPSFDVVFKSENSASIDMKQLVPYLQRKYGPIVRRPYLKQLKAKLTFGRIKDALKAVEDSPHFKSMLVIGEPAMPNLSYQYFQRSINLQLHLDRANDADRIEEAANIRVDCRMNEENERKGKRRDSARVDNSSESIDDNEKDEVLVCSPVKKIDNPEERSVKVRVCDDDKWLPIKDEILLYFEQFGNVTQVTFKDHLEGVIQFNNLEETTMALKSKYTKIGGVWISILPYSQTDNQ
ncbi:hypothetical protein PENTCL1PPCAC_27061, partial [Pristionchus entomophagus]